MQYSAIDSCEDNNNREFPDVLLILRSSTWWCGFAAKKTEAGDDARLHYGH